MKDLLGNKLEVGDVVIVARVAKNYNNGPRTPKLRIGFITGFDTGLYGYPVAIVGSRKAYPNTMIKHPNVAEYKVKYKLGFRWDRQSKKWKHKK